MSGGGLGTALTQWRRRWRLPEMKLLFLALLVSAMAVASVGFFTSRVEQAMLSQASQMLGGDLVLESARPFSPDYRAEAESLQLHQAESIHFRSMVAVGDRFQLVAVDAVSDAYPLRGQFEVADSPGAPARAMARSELRAGEVWAGQRLFTELGVRPGDTIQLGQRTFMLRQVLVRDPVAGDSLFELAPALIMPLADLESTGLLSPASRARFQLMFAGPPARIDALRTRLAPRLETTERIRSLADGAPTIRQSYERANRFLGLAALFSVVLAGAAIALTAASLIRHETPTVAVLKAFGLQRRTILRDYLTSLWGLALLAAGAGALLGYGLQWLVGGWLGSFAGIELPPAHWQPLLVALLTALVMVTGFSLPYLFNLMDTPAMQILRGNLHPRHPLGWLLALCILPAVFILLWLQAGELKLALWLFLGLLAGLLAFWGVTRLALAGLLRLGLRPGWEWLAPLRHSRRSSLLVVVFATGLFTLLLLASLRTDLVGRWQDSLPVDAPNYFLINIQPEERAELERFLAEKSLKANLFPMIRGRLTRINGEPVTVEQYADPRSRRLLEREFNLSELVTLPASNRLLAGAWFPQPGTPGLTVEEGIAESLRFRLGDRLTFDVAGQVFEEPVTSIREVRWDSMEPNFFVAASGGALERMPRTFITSLYIPPGQEDIVSQLVRGFPGVTVIDTGAILAQVRELVGQATFAVQGIFLFTLVAGVVVLFAALQSQRPERRRELAVLKSLGAGHRLLQRRIWLEFLLLGGLAGLLAGLLAMLGSNLAGIYLFSLDVRLNPLLLLAGTVSGALLVGAAAWFNLRGLLDTPPMDLFRG